MKANRFFFTIYSALINKSWCIAIVLIALFTLFWGIGEASSAHSSWTAYIGAQDKEQDWAETIRGVGRGVVGINVLKRAGITDSGIVKDTAKALLDGDQAFGNFLKKSNRILDERDIISPVSGLGSARIQEDVEFYFSIVERDGAKLWKELVYAQATEVLNASSGKKHSFYWQIGNEINSKHFSKALRVWSNRPGLVKRNDDLVIPLYVEYYLAPTVEALRKAGRDQLGSEEAMPILLGTITFNMEKGNNFWETVSWVDRLLEYEVKGDYASSLSGKKVSELVNFVGLQYLITRDGPDTSWAGAFDVVDKWRRRGAIKGVWETEELGIERASKCLGGSTALKVFARCMSRAIEKGYTPEQFRCNMWGWWIGADGTTGGAAMDDLLSITGPVSLGRSAVTVRIPGVAAESHAFRMSQNEVLAIIFPAKNQKGSFRQLEVSGQRILAEATLMGFGSAGRVDIPLKNISNNSLTLNDSGSSIKDLPILVIKLRFN